MADVNWIVAVDSTGRIALQLRDEQNQPTATYALPLPEAWKLGLNIVTTVWQLTTAVVDAIPLPAVIDPQAPKVPKP